MYVIKLHFKTKASQVRLKHWASFFISNTSAESSEESGEKHFDCRSISNMDIAEAAYLACLAVYCGGTFTASGCSSTSHGLQNGAYVIKLPIRLKDELNTS